MPCHSTACVVPVQPSKVLRNADGVVKLSDVVCVPHDLNDNCSGFFDGKSWYLAPETISATLASYTADTWAVGMILLELALGRYPYAGRFDNFVQMVEHVVHGPVPSLPESDATSPAFADLLGLCLCKDPVRRPSARDLLCHPFLNPPPPAASR